MSVSTKYFTAGSVEFVSAWYALLRTSDMKSSAVATPSLNTSAIASLQLPKPPFNLQRQLSRLNLLIIDELGFGPLSPIGAKLLFEFFSQRCERGSILVTTNLPFDEWTEVFGPDELLRWLQDTQDGNERAKRSHAKRRAALRASPGIPP